MSPLLVLVGDAVLDRDVNGTSDRLCPDAPVPVIDEVDQTTRPGGAALAAAMAARFTGDVEVVLVTALADDEAGRTLRCLLADAGVRVLSAALGGGTPEKIRFRSRDQSLLRLDRHGASAPIGAFPEAARQAIRAAGAVLISDYGRGVAGDAALRTTVAAARVPQVWDPHPRGAAPIPGMSLITPNRAELRGFFGADDDGLAATVERARRARRTWTAGAVAVTMGAEGALVVAGDGPPLVVPAERVSSGDPCGAGDSFAASAAVSLLQGALVSEAVTAAVADASRWVGRGSADGLRSRPGSADGLRSRPGSAESLPDQLPAQGHRLVVAGGCFDLLHAGHVALLEAARRLGDTLIVAINSDASVTRLKGPGRPVISEGDRAAVLGALGCVDGVVIFDEASPAAVLQRLRPQVFVKGGDYSGAELPEAAVLAPWGGQAVVVPYLSGRSTTGLLRQVSDRAP